MILCVYGDDTFRVREHVRMLVSAFREKHDPSGMNIADFSFENNEGDVVSAMRSAPFLAKRRMTVVRGLIESVTTKKDAATWTERMTGLGDASVIVLVDAMPAAKMDKNKLFCALRDAEDIHAYAFDALRGVALKKWVAQHAVTLGVSFETAAVEAIIERVGTDTWRLAQEMHKVAGACGKSKVVAVSDVEAHVDASPEDALFAFLDAVRSCQRAQAVQLLRQERGRGTASDQLMRMLAREVRLLALLRAYAAEHGTSSSQAAARELGIHPFVAKKMMPRAVSISEIELRRMIDAVLSADWKQKRSVELADAILDQLIIDLLIADYGSGRESRVFIRKL